MDLGEEVSGPKAKKSRKAGAPKVRKSIEKGPPSLQKPIFRLFWRLLRPFSRLFSDFWHPGLSRLFGDFLETCQPLSNPSSLPRPQKGGVLETEIAWAREGGERDKEKKDAPKVVKS